VTSAATPVAPAPIGLLAPRVLIPFVLVTLIWGSTWIVIRDQLGNVPPSWSVTYRFATAAAAMFLIAALRREPLLLSGRAWAFAALLGLAQFGFNFNFVYRAEGFITSGLVAVLFALLIVPNVVMGRLFLGNPIERRFVLGGGIAMLGVAMMIVHEVDVADRGLTAVLAGTALTLGGVFCASIANVMQGSSLARSQPMLTMVAWAMAFGSIADALFAFATVGPPVWDARPEYLAGVLYLGVVGSAITFPLYFGIIRAVGPGPAAWSSVLIPIIAMGFSTLLEGYVWAPLSIGGGVIALAGMVVALRRGA
jgi:drug/metabolite transporter (DMT)-like permease